jgi:hypothetical protein
MPTPVGAERVLIESAPQELPRSYDWAGAEQRHIGTVLHATLQQLAKRATLERQVPSTWSQSGFWRAQLAALGVPRSRLTDATATIQRGMDLTLADPRGRWLLSHTHRVAHSEWALSGILDGHCISVVIDRAFVDVDGDFWIVDFKSGTHQGSDLDAFIANEKLRYETQLTRYATLARLLGGVYAAPRTALYFPLLQRFEPY